MGFYYATERRKFDLEWEKTRKWYRECGMSEEAINEMYMFDLHDFNNRRSIAIYELEYDYTNDEYEESSVEYSIRIQINEKASCFDKYFLNGSAENAIEEISDDDLRAFLMKQSKTTKVILSLLAKGMNYTEIGQVLGIRRQNVCKRMEMD